MSPLYPSSRKALRSFPPKRLNVVLKFCCIYYLTDERYAEPGPRGRALDEDLMELIQVSGFYHSHLSGGMRPKNEKLIVAVVVSIIIATTLDRR
jgi:hypothetical protein